MIILSLRARGSRVKPLPSHVSKVTAEDSATVLQEKEAIVIFLQYIVTRRTRALCNGIARVICKCDAIGSGNRNTRCHALAACRCIAP